MSQKRVAEEEEEPAAQPTTHRADAIVVNANQKGNAVLEHITKTSWSYGSVVPDYELGRTTCAFFLSIRYHKLHPNYIYDRLRQLGKQYRLRILLVFVDQPNCEKSLRELTRISLLLDFCVVLAWSEAEAARYLETFKLFEHRSADSIREKQSQNTVQRAASVLTSLRKVNKTDALNLITSFQSVREIICADKEDLELCAGFGAAKIKDLLSATSGSFFPTPK